MPTSFLYDRDGALVVTHQGFRKKDAGELDSRMRDLLKKEPRP